MQQRFCTCGFSVWVEYRLNPSGCVTVFRAEAMPRSARVTRCPVCGRRIHIDELR